MIVIGPGGGKDVLTGLLAGVDDITGVEINPDIVNIVKDHKEFNGGIYTDFPNVNILVKEGRHYIKQEQRKYDLIVMALPSTEQLQNIDNFAMNENYLLTIEAIKDYLRDLFIAFGGKRPFMMEISEDIPADNLEHLLTTLNEFALEQAID